MATRLEELHEQDFYAWTKHQAEALRKLAAERWNGPLDLEHLAEEIEDVGDGRLDIAVSQLRRLMVHPLKLEHSPARDPRRQWIITVDDARVEMERRWTRTVGNEVGAVLEATYRQSRRRAVLELKDHAEREAATALPRSCPFSIEQLRDEGWYPVNRHGLVDEDDEAAP